MNLKKTVRTPPCTTSILDILEQKLVLALQLYSFSELVKIGGN